MLLLQELQESSPSVRHLMGINICSFKPVLSSTAWPRTSSSPLLAFSTKLVSFYFLFTSFDFRGECFKILVSLGKLSQDSENEQNSVSLEVLLIKVCHKKRKVCWYLGIAGVNIFMIFFCLF